MKSRRRDLNDDWLDVEISNCLLCSSCYVFKGEIQGMCVGI